MEEMRKETIEKVERTVEDILKDAIQSRSISISRASGEVGIMSVTKAKTGNRISVSKKSLEKLNNPEKLQIAFTEDSVIFGEKLPNNSSSFNIKMSGTKGVIYSTQLVNEIAELFDLDFSDGKTSMTFYEVEYLTVGGYLVAVVKVK